MSNIELIDTSSKRTLTDSLTEHLQTPYFKVEQFGFLVLTTSEQYPDTWYPTPKDIYPGGWFTIETDNGIAGDFNGDGLQDLVIHPMMFPHIVPRNTTIDPLFLLQNPDGTFQSPSSAIEGANFPDKFMLYRFGAADFNGDGITDVAMSTMNRPLNVRTGNEEVTTTAESPLVVYGNQSTFTWTDTYKNLTTEADQTGYNSGHSMTAGDFNGDGLSDWFSAGYVAYSDGESFTAKRLVANANAASGTNGWIGEWFWWNVNACAAADFNEDGFSDLVYSCMPAVDDGTYDGGDLYVVLGSNQGLKDGLDVIQVDRTNNPGRNVGTNFIVAADFNGDGHQDLILLEHGWVSDTGDSTKYYSEGKFRLFVGNGSGDFSEESLGIMDPYAGHRSGEGNLFAIDVNGDGWVDLVSTGYLVKSEDSWNSSSTRDSTCIFLNDHGVLKLVPTTDMAYVQPYQFAGDEIHKDFLQNGTQRMYPVDLGSDGLIDFVGFVGTPLHTWPQVEQIYNYAYISKGIAPLGRTTINENLKGTLGNDVIYGYDGNDDITGDIGDDILYGGDGIDTAVFLGSRSQYQVDLKSGSIIDSQTGRDGDEIIVSIERLHFSDTNVALDITGTAGQAYRIYKAAFDRAPDAGGLGFWISAMDDGASLTSVAAGFISSPEFQKLYGANVSDRDFVTKLYNNVLDRNPDQGGYDFWLGALADGATREDILVNFSESKENIANVADLIANGIQYQEWTG